MNDFSFWADSLSLRARCEAQLTAALLPRQKPAAPPRPGKAAHRRTPARRARTRGAAGRVWRRCIPASLLSFLAPR